MKVKYIGPQMDGVYVPALDADVAHGETVDVDDALGASLCEQTGTWQAVTTTAKPKNTNAPTGPTEES